MFNATAGTPEHQRLRISFQQLKERVVHFDFQVISLEQAVSGPTVGTAAATGGSTLIFPHGRLPTGRQC